MKKFLLISLIFINTIMMMIITCYLMKLPWLASDEKFLIWSTTAMNFATRDRPDSEDFVLINTSYDLELIDRYDEFGFPVGNQAITDRQKLAQFFHALNSANEKPRYIITDIHFVDSSLADQQLAEELYQLDNVILSAHINQQGNLELPIFDQADYGISDYLIGSAFDGVYKYQLIHGDSIKLLPLKVFEALSQQSSVRFGPFVKIGPQWTMNNFIMNYRILQKDIYDLEAGFNPVSLGELLYLSDEDIQQFVAGKIVVVGDFFENDMHETVLEVTAGPLILLNAFLTIKHGDTVVNFWFFLLIAMTYAFLSYLAFVEGDIIEKYINKLLSKNITRYIAGFASYFLSLIFISICSYLLFNIHINVFFMAIAFYTVDRLAGYFLHRRGSVLEIMNFGETNS
ncbi:CHASE2 domain-containing protein [Ekhidna sp.]|uniref:CHASE2 domain-containing protein n=1 Tax=Ekhidna sp. TaxID=2608089 RepID=UPI00329A4C83